MAEQIVFLTGRLAKPRLERILASLANSQFGFQIVDIGVKVAALMTVDIIRRRLPAPLRADRVILPGRFRGDLDVLRDHYGTPFQRGPDDLKDLGEFFGRKGPPPDLSRHDVRIFAEVVEAPNLDVATILERAALYRRDGADVIDIGCLPDTPFPHLEEAVAALTQAGFTVSIDSANPTELRRGAHAGAKYLLSLTEKTLSLADDVDATPVLIPARHGDLKSLIRAMDVLDHRNRPYFADPILDPIHFGFTQSLARYAELRRLRPKAPILMGTGNLTELTDADSTGVTAMLMGIASELNITNVLVVQVSPHCRRAIAETDWARRIMFAAREAASLPVGLAPALLGLHDRKPFPDMPAEIAEMASMITDANYRVATAEDGIHIYNRHIHRIAIDPFQLFPHLGVEADGSHAFYLGVETAKAQIAWQLGKRYVQDQPLRWGAAVEQPEEDLLGLKKPGPTLPRQRRRRSP
jgi:dihydropteroate synthase-like protein